MTTAAAGQSVFIATLALLIPLFWATLVYGAILLGWYKDPLLDRFFEYGEETRLYPLPTFLFFLGCTLTLFAYMLEGSIMGFDIMGVSLLLTGWAIHRSVNLRVGLGRFASALILFGLMWLTLGVLQTGANVLWLAAALMIWLLAGVSWWTPPLRISLPRWYQTMLQETTREERRALAIAWGRLPTRTRFALNSNQAAFAVFVEQVRMTVIYGAKDPR